MCLQHIDTNDRPGFVERLTSPDTVWDDKLSVHGDNGVNGVNRVNGVIRVNGVNGTHHPGNVTSCRTV